MLYKERENIMFNIGIDLGGTNIKVGIIDEKGIIIIKDKIPAKRERSYQEIVEDMAKLAIKLTQISGISLKQIESIGIGLPGNIDCDAGTIIYANNFPFINAPIREEIKKHIDLPIYLENDANCATLAESVVGAAKDAESSFVITIGTGIGSGAIIDGKLFRGHNFAAPEAGHVVIVNEGVLCSCGRCGCLEAYASAEALVAQTKAAATKNPNSKINELVGGELEKIDARIPFKAAKQNDKTAIAVLDKYIDYLADGITNIINCFQPEILAIGGGVSNESDYFLEPLKKLVSKRVYSRGNIAQTQIVIAKLGNNAGIIGASMLGKNHEKY